MHKYEFTNMDKQAEKAMKEAVSNVVTRTIKLDSYLVVWQDGKVKKLTASKLKAN